MINIDFQNDDLTVYMDEHESYPEMVFGETADGEDITISICADCIITETLQKNGVTRKDIYHRDGSHEEIYNREEE